MDLLFKRAQDVSSITGRTNFKLWAKLDLDDEEQRLIRKYDFDKAMLLWVDQPGLVRNSFILGFFSFVILIPIIAFNFWRSIGLGWIGVICVAAILAILIGVIVYHQLRETIYVRDLMYGRYFTCRSVVDLSLKEAHLVGISGVFRQTLESAKNWGGTDKLTIEALPPEEARAVMLRKPVF